MHVMLFTVRKFQLCTNAVALGKLRVGLKIADQSRAGLHFNSQNTHSHFRNTGVCGQGMSNVFAAPPVKYFVIFFRLSIPNPNRNPNLKP